MSFSLDIAKFAKKAVGNAHKVVRKTVIDIGKEVTMRTPVGDPSYWQRPPPPGYTGGHARANWSHSQGVLVVQEFEAIDPGTSISDNRIAGSVPVDAAGKTHFISNSVPYIRPLEDGHSRQAPNGMVGLTVRGWRRYLTQALRELA